MGPDGPRLTRSRRATRPPPIRSQADLPTDRHRTRPFRPVVRRRTRRPQARVALPRRARRPRDHLSARLGRDLPRRHRRSRRPEGPHPPGRRRSRRLRRPTPERHRAVVAPRNLRTSSRRLIPQRCGRGRGHRSRTARPAVRDPNRSPRPRRREHRPRRVRKRRRASARLKLRRSRRLRSAPRSRRWPTPRRVAMRSPCATRRDRALIVPRQLRARTRVALLGSARPGSDWSASTRGRS